MSRWLFILFACLVFAAPARAQTDENAGPPVMETGRVQLPTDLGALNIPTDQDKASALDKTLEALGKLPPKTQQALLEESLRNRGYCMRNTTLSNFYDCSCFSLRMLDSRIKRGPGVAMNNMIHSTDLSMCADTVNAAGFFYNRCLDTLKLQHLPDKDLTAMCECGARRAALQWQHQPAASSRIINAVFMQNILACQNELRPSVVAPPPP